MTYRSDMELTPYNEMARRLKCSPQNAKNEVDRALVKAAMLVVKKRITLQDLLQEDYRQRRVFNLEEPE